MAPAAVMPILKANACEHGRVPVGRHLVSLGARSLGVTFLLLHLEPPACGTIADGMNIGSRGPVGEMRRRERLSVSP
jgi:hypothetical protein